MMMMMQMMMMQMMMMQMMMQMMINEYFDLAVASVHAYVNC